MKVAIYRWSCVGTLLYYHLYVKSNNLNFVTLKSKQINKNNTKPKLEKFATNRGIFEIVQRKARNNSHLSDLLAQMQHLRITKIHEYQVI